MGSKRLMLMVMVMVMVGNPGVYVSKIKSSIDDVEDLREEEEKKVEGIQGGINK